MQFLSRHPDGPGARCADWREHIRSSPETAVWSDTRGALFTRRVERGGIGKKDRRNVRTSLDERDPVNALGDSIVDVFHHAGFRQARAKRIDIRSETRLCVGRGRSACLSA